MTAAVTAQPATNENTGTSQAGASVFPVCGFSGVVSKGSGKRLCMLDPDRRKFVGLDTCLACPQAGRLSTDLFPICNPPQNRSIDCCHRGEQVSTVGCPTCGGGTAQIPVFACGIHEDCTIDRDAGGGTKCCRTCKEQTPVAKPHLPPLTGPANLLWFVYPRKETSAIWQAQQEKIREAISRFDGLKLLAIAVDESTDQEAVERDLWDEVVELPNDPQVREVNGWRWGMERLKDQPGFTVWLHAKGVTRGTIEQHLVRWWELGYGKLLDPVAVRASLDSAPITGVFRRHVNALGVPWHYSGAFYAVRNDAIRFPPSNAEGWYAEAWPALIAKSEEAGCMAFDGAPDLYIARNWR
jgi:hypothetical protein